MDSVSKHPKISLPSKLSAAQAYRYYNCRFRDVADKCGALLLCDMAHFSGLFDI